MPTEHPESTGNDGPRPCRWPPHPMRVLRWLLVAAYVVGAIILPRHRALGTTLMLIAEFLLEHFYSRID